jgi:hypothetical protein
VSVGSLCLVVEGWWCGILERWCVVVLLGRSSVVLMYWGRGLVSIGRFRGRMWGGVLVAGVLMEVLLCWWVGRMVSSVGVSGVSCVSGVLV